MLNWEVDPRLIEPYVPRGTQLDFHGGKTYLSLVGFLFLDTRVLGIPVPWHRNFEEVNLRFYVCRQEGDQLKRAVGFIREIVPRRAIAGVARWAYNEPYVAVPMRHHHVGVSLRADEKHARQISVEYAWRWKENWLQFGMECHDDPAPLVPGTHQHFIVEHYWGYTRQRDGGTVEYRVEHPGWNVWRAQRLWMAPGVAAYYPPAFASLLSKPPTTAFLADGSKVRVYQPRRIA
jgi:uncharacterized protein YqjF (DUF2071 family)